MALLERERELELLQTAIGDISQGRSRVVIVEGAAGIGKTGLLTEARRLAAEAELRQLSARGGELEREFAFGVVRQLFEPALIDGGATALSGAASAARGVFELTDGDAEIDRTDPSFASLHGLYWLAANLSAQRPLAISIDDLHWCDAPSLRFLAYLVRRLEGLGILVMCTLRPSARIDWASLSEITNDPLTISIQPRPLSASAGKQIVRVRLGGDVDDAFATACHTATQGNPLLLHELLRTLEGEGIEPDAAHVSTVAELGPRAASRAVLVRLARLPAEAAGLAHAAAVLGDDAELPIVAALAGTTIERASAVVTALVRAEVLRPEPPLGFVHPLIASAVLLDMGSVERALAHERAARLLADRSARAERVAAHLLLSPGRGEPWVAQTLIDAARSSLQKGAADSAVAYLTRALREPPPVEHRAQLLLELGSAEARTNGADAVEHLTEAHELLEEPGTKAQAAELLARLLLLTGEPVQAARLARRAADELPPELADTRLALEARELMAALIGGGDDEALRRLQRHRRRPTSGVGAKMLAAVAVQEWALSGGPSDACAELASQALAGGELVAADGDLLGVAAIVILALADRDEALHAWELSLAEAHRRGSLFSRKSVTLWRGFAMYLRGDLAEAEESLRSSAEGKTWGAVTGWLYHDAILSAVLRERGDLVSARDVLEGSTDPGDAAEPTRYWLYSQLELLVAEGRFSDALVVSDSLGTRFAEVVHPVDTPWRSPTAIALDRLGRAPQARALAVEDLELARRWGAPGTVGRALRVLGTLEREAGLDHLYEAVDVVASSPARLEYAKALASLGGALRRARRPTDARAPLRQALELAAVLGAEGLEQHVRSELYAAGGRPRTTAVRGLAALTPSERRAAALAATGETNREIAQQLFVSLKTVELHLSNAYRKLGIRSRRELPAGLESAERLTATPEPLR